MSQVCILLALAHLSAGIGHPYHLAFLLATAQTIDNVVQGLGSGKQSGGLSPRETAMQSLHLQ